MSRQQVGGLVSSPDLGAGCFRVRTLYCFLLLWRILCGGVPVVARLVSVRSANERTYKEQYGNARFLFWVSQRTLCNCFIA